MKSNTRSKERPGLARKLLAILSITAIISQVFVGLPGMVSIANAAVSDGFCNVGDATITSPISGSAHKGAAVSVGWTFNDIDCTTTDPAVFDIQSSHDGGGSWVTIATSALPSSTSVNFDSTAGQTPDDTDYQFRLNK